MKVTRQQLIRALQDRLGARKLVWVGTRGQDGASLLELPQFSEAYSIIAPLGSVSLAVDFSLEEASGQRVDLDTYKLDDDWTPPAQKFRSLLLNSLTEPAVVVAYRPFALLSALCYPRSDFVTYLGMFHERQATFEHKPWVESELRKIGIPVIPWRYFATEDRIQLEEQVAALGTVVLRTNRSDGGAGLTVISGRKEACAQIPQTKDGFFAAAPYLSAHIPLNINACIFRDGGVTLHPASLQLIGIKECSRRRFGYCGNDFSAIKELEGTVIAKLEAVTMMTARWLYSQGYLGAFGLDALVHNEEVLLAEINPRFQGSSLLSARLDKSLERPDIFLCHLASYMYQPTPPFISLIDLVRHQDECSQILLHNNGERSYRASFDYFSANGLEIELCPARGISIHPDATIARAIVRGRVTQDGRGIDRSFLESIKSYLDPIYENADRRPQIGDAACASRS